MSENTSPYNLIMTVVNRGFADQVVDAAREVGARGGTVFYARGTGIHEVEKFFAISIQPEKEVVLTIIRKENTKKVMSKIIEAAGLMTEGRGLSFALPVSDIVGIVSEWSDDTDSNEDDGDDD